MRTEHPGSRYYVLDALRFVLASWVAVGHLGVFPFVAAAHPTGIARLIGRGMATLVWGPPAVMAFFVISGFCIHYPAASGKTLRVAAFYGRRYTRVLIPVAAAVLLWRMCVGKVELFGADSVLWKSPLWSLLCEEIYYAIYPAIRWARVRTSWNYILAISAGIGILISLRFRGAAGWEEIGPWATAATLYPVWLLGCILAEQADHLAAIARPLTIWGWRLAAWSGMWITEMLHFHGHIFLTVTLAPFGVLAYFWIRNEIAFYKIRKAPAFLSRGGKWSYSLYLIHPVAISFVALRFPIISDTTGIGWLATAGIIYASAYGFYLLVERPSHRLARKIHFAFDNRNARLSAGELVPTSPGAGAGVR